MTETPTLEEKTRQLLREGHLPHIWCPGCSNGITTRALLRAVLEAGLDARSLVFVSGIGCSSRTVGYLDFDGMHTTHGRALAFATGIKLARPELHVVVITGDGDTAAIGGNHFIHAARRNVDLTVLCYNNSIYGMTGGQYSPTTHPGDRATTAPYGHLERPFDLCELARAAGATYVARGTPYHFQPLVKLIAAGLRHRGFAFVEIMSTCPVYYGRQNAIRSAPEHLELLAKKALTAAQAASLPPEERAGRFLIGELHRQEAPEYTEQYLALIERERRRRQELEAAAPRAVAGVAGEKPLAPFPAPLDRLAAGREAAEERPGRGGPEARDGRTRWEVRLAGTGGQGQVLAAIILADAAGLHAGYNVVQTQDYGPESRGGASKAEVILTTDPEVDYPKATAPDVLVAMSQPAFDRYAAGVRPGGVVLADSTWVRAAPSGKARVLPLPLTQAARERLGRALVANVVALGALAAVFPPVPLEALERAVLRRAPRGTEDLNRRALQLGYAMGRQATEHDK